MKNKFIYIIIIGLIFFTIINCNLDLKEDPEWSGLYKIEKNYLIDQIISERGLEYTSLDDESKKQMEQEEQSITIELRSDYKYIWKKSTQILTRKIVEKQNNELELIDETGDIINIKIENDNTFYILLNGKNIKFVKGIFIKESDNSVFLKKELSSTEFSIDIINYTSVNFNHVFVIPKNLKKVNIKGWAIDERSQTAAGAVYVHIDDKFYITNYGHERNDIARKFKSDECTNSGFEVNIPLSEIGEGEHTLSLKVLTYNKKAYYNTKTLKIKVE